MASPTFALNHMVAPRLPLAQFFALGKDVGVTQFEIRNDLSGNAILDGTSPQTVRSLANAAGVDLISINALQRFNEWTTDRESEAKALADYAADCGAKALVLVPVNDGTGKGNGERQANLRTALKGLKPILEAAGIIGLVEPLGFQICSLRSKREAAEAIADIGGTGRFKLVHDTFHHVLSGEPQIYPDVTGLVHISGVDDQKVAVDEMLDPHRVMVTHGDRLNNIAQIRALLAAGYVGPLSFEPFAASVHASADASAMVRDSMNYVRNAL